MIRIFATAVIHSVIAAATLLEKLTFQSESVFSDPLPWIIAAVIVVVGLFLLLFLVVCLWERQHLVGDVEPTQEPFPYPPSAYWLRTRENAARIGLRYVGDYATRKDTTLVKGLQTLYLNDNCQVLVSVISGSAVGAKLKKTILRTRLASGRILESTDDPGIADVTGVIDRGVLLNAGIEELMRFHAGRIQACQSAPLTFNASAALEEHERIDLERGKRLVLLRLAYWVNPQETCIRLTLRGALAYVKSMFANIRKLQPQQHRTHIRRAG